MQKGGALWFLMQAATVGITIYSVIKIIKETRELVTDQWNKPLPPRVS